MCLSYKISSSKIIGVIERRSHVFRDTDHVVSSQSSFRIFYTSLSSVAYDSMEFHLTRPCCEGDIGHVKEIPSLFLSARGKCSMPRVSVRLLNGAVDAFSHKIFHEIYSPLGTHASDSTLHMRIFESHEKSVSEDCVDSNHPLAEYQYTQRKVQIKKMCWNENE